MATEPAVNFELQTSESPKISEICGQEQIPESSQQGAKRNSASKNKQTKKKKRTKKPWGCGLILSSDGFEFETNP